jgi:8-oxo-dGTP pyrophosphatase MutT (NUDIX family)
MPETHEVCLKLALFDAEGQVLLARRHGEELYDGVFSLIGGKMDGADPDLIASMRREKNEEIGSDARVRVLPTLAVPVHYTKPSGVKQLLLHYAAAFDGGRIDLNPYEYSEFTWTHPAGIPTIGPIVPNLPLLVPALSALRMAGGYVQL